MIHDGRSRFETSLVQFLTDRQIPLPPSDDVAPGPPLKAQVNTIDTTSRWIVECPAEFCGGAMYVWLDDPRFFCTTCRNFEAGGKWRQVEVPPDRERIEALLMRRPRAHNRHWLPDETASDLAAENEAHGIAGNLPPPEGEASS